MKRHSLILFFFLACSNFLLAQNGIVITPNVGEPSSQLAVTLTGINTQFSVGTFTMQFFKQGTGTSQIAASNFQIKSPNTLEASVFIKGSATIGAYSFKLNHTVTGQSNGLNSFFVGNPATTEKITSISPNIGSLNQNLTVSISGSRTRFTQGSQSLAFFQNGSPTSAISINGIRVENDSLVNVDLFIPANTSRGFYDIAIGNFSSFFFKPASFEVTWASSIKEEEETSIESIVYPNPAKELIHIQTKDALMEQAEVLDMQGRLVQTELPAQPTKNIELHIGEFLLPDQQFILKIHTNKGVIFKRILVN